MLPMRKKHQPHIQWPTSTRFLAGRYLILCKPDDFMQLGRTFGMTSKTTHTFKAVFPPAWSSFAWHPHLRLGSMLKSKAVIQLAPGA